jgi:hypothetical protein
MAAPVRARRLSDEKGQAPWPWLCLVGLPRSCQRVGAPGLAAAGQPDARGGDPGQQQRG